MIKTKIFCPYERIASLLSYKVAGKVDLLSINFKVGDFEKRVSAIADGLDHNLGFSISQREAALAAPAIEFSVDYIKGDKVVKTRNGVCKNVLYTEPFVSNAPTNSEDGLRRQYTHAEAVHTYATKQLRESKFVRSEAGVEGLVEMIPYCNYIFDSIKDEFITILGPAPLRMAKLMGVVKQVDEKFPIYCLSDNPFELTDDNSENGMNELHEQAFKVVTRDVSDGSESIFKFGQISIAHNGVKLDYATSLQIIKSVVAWEDATARGVQLRELVDNKLVFEIRRVGSRYRLTEAELQAYEKDVEENIRVNQLFNNIHAADNGLYLTCNNKQLQLVGDGSMSCYAMSLAFLIAQVGGATYTSFIQAVNQLIDRRYITDNGAGKVMGATAKYNSPENTMTFELTSGSATVVKKAYRREITKKEELASLSGLYILGLDPDTVSHYEDSDHYIVVNADKGALYVVFDPYEYINLAPGTNVTAYFGQKDSHLFEFVEV